MGARLNDALGWMLAVMVGVGCAGRSTRLEGDDGGEGASGGVGGSEVSAGSGGSGVGASGGAGGSISTGGGAVSGAGGTAGTSLGGTGGVAGAGATSGSVGEGGAAAGPPLEDPTWFHSGSLQLSPRAFQRTVAQLLGLAHDEALPRQPLLLQPGLDPKVDAPVSGELASIARDAVTAMDDAALRMRLGCDDASRACAETIAEQFAPEVFRRPLEPGEPEAILAAYDAVISANPVKETVIAVFSFPSAQWIRAVGTADERGSIRLDDQELASLLSYGLTGLPPDAQLRASAAGGELRDARRRREEADRLIRTQEGRITYRALIRDWFRIREPETFWFYEQDPVLAEAMELETTRFIDVATFEDGAPASELLAAPWSMLTEELVEHYGIVRSNASDLVGLSATRRRGILHHGSFLASHSYGEQGGLISRSVATLRLLCEMVPEPPIEVPPIPPPEPALTYRDRLSQVTASVGCQGCHSSLDPVAFSFGKFDGYGAFVELDNGVPIDTSGTVQTFEGWNFTFADSADLAEQLAAHPGFTECFTRNVVVSFAGAPLFDLATSDYVHRSLSDGSAPAMIETVLAWVESEHFVRRVLMQ